MSVSASTRWKIQNKTENKSENETENKTEDDKEKEEEIRCILDETPSAEDIIKMLDVVGLDMREFYDLYGAEKINNAVLYAKDLKDRYTVLWLYYDLFGGERNC